MLRYPLQRYDTSVCFTRARPQAGFELADEDTRSWRLGGRLNLNSSLDLNLEGSRHERPGAAPEHRLELTASLRR